MSNINNSIIIKYKEEKKDGDIKYYYHMTEETAKEIEFAIKKLNLKIEKDSFLREIHQDNNIKNYGNQKRIVYSFTKKKEEKTLSEFVDYLKEKNNKNKVGLNKSYIVKIIEDNEEICRKIIIKLYNDFFKKIYEHICFVSFYNINMIIIKNWENSIEYKINPFEFYITLKIRFTSGTFTTQAPLKQILVMNSASKQYEIKKKKNKTILQFIGILTKYIINCKLDKSFDLISIPYLISQECRTFLETCFLNLKEFEELQYLDFLDEKIEFKQFHYNYPQSEERSLSYFSSILKDEEPKKKKMIKNNHLINMNNSFSILGLNSFCIKPEEKKINYKDKEEIENRKISQKNLNEDNSLPLDDIILAFYSDEKNTTQEYSINDILKKKIEDSERIKKLLIKEYLQPVKIYTYPIAQNKKEIYKNNEITIYSKLKSYNNIYTGAFYILNNSSNNLSNVKLNFSVKKNVIFKVISTSGSDLSPNSSLGIKKEVTIQNNDISKSIVIKMVISYNINGKEIINNTIINI